MPTVEIYPGDRVRVVGTPRSQDDAPSTVGSGTDEAPAVPVARLVPKIEITEPGATGVLKLAALTMPPGETV